MSVINCYLCEIKDANNTVVIIYSCFLIKSLGVMYICKLT